MAPPILKLDNIHLTFGGTPLLTGAGLTAGPGDRICFVGRNGSGKSTMMKIAAGVVEPDSGERFVHPSARLRYLGQETNFSGFATVHDCVTADLGPSDDPHRAQRLLEALGLTGAEDPANLSGGETRRVAIAAALAPEPELLLLDEPTNHLDLPTIEWLEAELRGLRAGIVLISHDRRFLEKLSRQTVWLDRGVTRNLDRGFTDFEAWRDKLLEEEEIERHKLDRKIAREQKWMHGGVTGRRKRNVRRVAELATLRQAKREHRAVTGNVNMEISESQTSGKIVMEGRGLSKSFDGVPIVTDVSVRIVRGDRLGLVGANGAGKTTLLKMLTGVLAPDSGEIRIGTNLEMVTLDQRREALSPDMRVADTLTGGRGDYVTINGFRRHVASYLEDFLFQGEQAMSPVKVLSGGERARLLLARALVKPSNVLVLDEPTNDLDLETLDLLQEMLGEYPGTILLVSHDRDFLDRVATSVLVAEGGGRWTEYAGGYTDMLAQRKAAPGGKRGDPIRIKAGGDATAASKSAEPERARRKLSFKDKHALDTLPRTIEELTAEIARLQTKLAGTNLYAKYPAEFAKSTARLAAATAELAAAEERWIELELLRSEIEGS